MASLDYITIENVEWVSDRKRKHVDPIVRREKHRLVQRRFVARKRQRMLELRLQFLLAHQEEQRLLQEKETLLECLLGVSDDSDSVCSIESDGDSDKSQESDAYSDTNADAWSDTSSGSSTFYPDELQYVLDILGDQ